MGKQPRIGIMVAKRNGRQASLKLYQHYSHPSLRLYAFTPADILWKKRRIVGLSLTQGVWRQTSFPFPDAVYNRCFNNKLDVIAKLEKEIGQGTCFNRINRFNKWRVHCRLAKSSVGTHVPQAALYRNTDVSKMLETRPLLFIKPVYGARGESVHRLERTRNGEVLVSLHSTAPRYIIRKNEDLRGTLGALLGRKEYIVQQGIHTVQHAGRYFDIRALVQKDRQGDWAVSALTCRVAYKYFFNTSVCETWCEAAEIVSKLYSVEKTDRILQSVSMIAISAAESAVAYVGTLGELSVDFVLDRSGKLWIVELNGKPQKTKYNDMSEAIRGKVYGTPLDYAHYLSLLPAAPRRRPAKR